jgi:hypothetical protein
MIDIGSSSVSEAANHLSSIPEYTLVVYERIIAVVVVQFENCPPSAA